MKDIKIVEEILEIENPLVVELFAQTGWTKEEILETKTTKTKVVYLKKEKPILITGTLSSEIKTDILFEEILNKIEKEKFADLLLLTTFYDWGFANVEGLILSQKTFSKNAVVDDILSISKGLLIYEYQFELLAKIFLEIVDNDEAKLLRRNAVNMKKPSAYDNYPINKVDEFRNVIREREVKELGGILANPNFRGAKILCDYLSE